MTKAEFVMAILEKITENKQVISESDLGSEVFENASRNVFQLELVLESLNCPHTTNEWSSLWKTLSESLMPY